MTKFGRLLTQAFFLGYWLASDVVASQRLENDESDATRLRTYWEGFGDAPVGCAGHVETTYKWRANDWENNLVELLLAWSHGILGGHLDIAVVLEAGSCALETGCDAEGAAETTAESAWSPFFLPMPHLCVFDTQQDWEDFMEASNAAPEVKEAALSNLEKDIDVGEDPTVGNVFQSGETDLVESMTMGLDRLLSYLQPRVTDGVRSFLDSPGTENFEAVESVGMHVRDIPPRKYGAYEVSETLDCFERVFKVFEDRDNGARSSGITRVWLVSEDDTALPEAKKLAGRYFRNVKGDDVFQIAGPTLPPDAPAGPVDAADAPGDVAENDALIHLVAQLEVLASADVFVGAFSANLSRLVFLRREALHRLRGTCVSTDKLSQFPK